MPQQTPTPDHLDGDYPVQELDAPHSHPVEPLDPAVHTAIDFIVLVHAIKREVHKPRPSLVGNYNSIVEIRDLIAKFEKDH